MELEKFIKVFDNTMDPKIIGSCIQYLNTLEFEDAGIICKNDKNNIVKSIRNTQIWGLKSNTLSDIHWRNLWSSVILNLFHQYRNSLNIEVPAVNIASLDALKYEEGGFYKPHSDSHLNYPRTISVVYFLNNDYEGGELVFHTPDKDLKEFKKIKAAPGRAILWPSNFIYPHSVSKVTKGRRYALISWLA